MIAASDQPVAEDAPTATDHLRRMGDSLLSAREQLKHARETMSLSDFTRIAILIDGLCSETVDLLTRRAAEESRQVARVMPE